MEIYLNRNGEGKRGVDIATIGSFTYQLKTDTTVRDVECLTMEDDYDEKKVYGHTRIKAGRYQVKLRKYGRHHDKYKLRFPEFHIGMLQIMDVPEFTDILIHCGCTPMDTAGCVLTGTRKIHSTRIVGSEIAYREIYPPIAKILDETDELVFINIID